MLEVRYFIICDITLVATKTDRLYKTRYIYWFKMAQDVHEDTLMEQNITPTRIYNVDVSNFVQRSLWRVAVCDRVTSYARRLKPDRGL